MAHNDELKNLQPRKEFFVGIDSDGCAFPTMELKHKECFIPNIINFMELQGVRSMPARRPNSSTSTRSGAASTASPPWRASWICWNGEKRCASAA